MAPTGSAKQHRTNVTTTELTDAPPDDVNSKSWAERRGQAQDSSTSQLQAEQSQPRDQQPQQQSAQDEPTELD